MSWSWVVVILLALVVPLLAWRSASGIGEAGLRRGSLYVHAAVSLWVLGALGYLGLKLDDGALRDVGVFWSRGGWSFLAWTLGLTAGGLGLFAGSVALRRWGWLPMEGEALRRLRPRGVGEGLLLALVLSPSAGLCEEFLYRGFMFRTIESPIGSAWAALVSSAAFGCAHAYQGWTGAVRAMAIGLILCAAPLMTGSIVPAMAAHALVDVVGVLLLWPWLEEMDPTAP